MENTRQRQKIQIKSQKGNLSLENTRHTKTRKYRDRVKSKKGNLSLANTRQRQSLIKTRSSWLNYALLDDEAVYWVSIGHYEAVAVGN